MSQSEEKVRLVAAKGIVERQCAVSRKVKPVSELIRFVAGPDGKVVPDLKRNLPGRGVWISADRRALKTAVGKKIFARQLGLETEVKTDLPDQVEELLERRALGSLGMACKAGLVVTGFAKTSSSARSGNVTGVICASDASKDSLRKLQAAVLAGFGSLDRIPICSSFSSNQLSATLGCGNVVNVALLKGRASDIFIANTEAFEQFRKNAEKQAA